MEVLDLGEGAAVVAAAVVVVVVGRVDAGVDVGDGHVDVAYADVDAYAGAHAAPGGSAGVAHAVVDVADADVDAREHVAADVRVRVVADIPVFAVESPVGS